MASIPENKLSRRDLSLLAITTLLGLGVYLLAAGSRYRLGFPLDDAWIHLTYARNLALRGEWAFIPGQISGGSTSPLWTMLLVPGFWLGIPQAWVYLLGGGLFFALAWRVEWAARQLYPVYRPPFPFAGLFLLFEWHLAWAASSGMEVLLHSFLAVVFFSLFLTDYQNDFVYGLLIALAIWSRPDAVTLLGPAALGIFVRPASLQSKIAALLRLAGGFFCLFIPYLVFNSLLTGTPWPNTFYAKQVEYASWQASPFYKKLVELVSRLVSGYSVVLLPGVVLLAWRSWRERHWRPLLALIWFVGYCWIYVSRLPLYQYGRYIMPALAVYLLLGLAFLFGWAAACRTRLERRIRFIWISLLGGMAVAFWGLGAAVYADNVSWIESQMVESARWASQNLPDQAVVASHDIGALGYFSPKHSIIDLAGLISPEVIPWMMDEAALKPYLKSKGMTHLIAPPSWYPEISRNCQPIYTVNDPFDHFDQLSANDSVTIYDCDSP